MTEIKRVDNNKLFKLISGLITCGFRGSDESIANEHIKEYCNSFSWISVKDRLPEPGKNVVVYENPSISIAFHLTDEKGSDWWSTDGNDPNPTHWMEIPEPPKENK